MVHLSLGLDEDEIWKRNMIIDKKYDIRFVVNRGSWRDRMARKSV